MLLAVLFVACPKSTPAPVPPPAPEPVPQPVQDADIDPKVAIRRTVQRNGGALTTCYERKLKVDPTLQGRIEIAWNVANGVVTDTPEVRLNELDDVDVANCIVTSIQGWTFPPQVEGPVVYPFVFRPSN